MSDNILLEDYVDEFAELLKEQLRQDRQRWGDTWRHRSREGQELRIRARYNDYFDQFENGERLVNWMAVTGNALIAWVRENKPDTLL